MQSLRGGGGADRHDDRQQNGKLAVAGPVAQFQKPRRQTVENNPERRQQEQRPPVVLARSQSIAAPERPLASAEVRSASGTTAMS